MIIGAIIVFGMLVRLAWYLHNIVAGMYFDEYVKKGL